MWLLWLMLFCWGGQQTYGIRTLDTSEVKASSARSWEFIGSLLGGQKCVDVSCTSPYKAGTTALLDFLHVLHAAST